MTPSVFGLSHGPEEFPLDHMWEMAEQVHGPGIGIASALLRLMHRGGIFTTAHESGVRLGLEVVHSSKRSLDTLNVPFGHILFLSLNACLVQYNALHWQLNAQDVLPLACLPWCLEYRRGSKEVP